MDGFIVCIFVLTVLFHVGLDGVITRMKVEDRDGALLDIKNKAGGSIVLVFIASSPVKNAGKPDDEETFIQNPAV